VEYFFAPTSEIEVATWNGNVEAEPQLIESNYFTAVLKLFLPMPTNCFTYDYTLVLDYLCWPQ
jgi:hypothetical protein